MFSVEMCMYVYVYMYIYVCLCVLGCIYVLSLNMYI